MNEPDVLIVGAGLAGLVAAHELVKAGRRVLIVEQENRNNLGGQAFWSLAGLFFVDSPEQRRMGINDSYELALQDWMGSAGFDREREDFWPRQWAEAYVRFAASDKRRYLFDLGLRVTPIVGWAERGDGSAHGHGNSVPRFHLTWGTGPELVRIFAEPVIEGEQQGLVEFAFRHRVDELIVEDGAVVGVRGSVLEPCDTLERGRESSREAVGEFSLRARAVVVCSGGIGRWASCTSMPIAIRAHRSKDKNFTTADPSARRCWPVYWIRSAPSRSGSVAARNFFGSFLTTAA